MKYEQLTATCKQSGFDGIAGWGVLNKSRGLPAEAEKRYSSMPAPLNRTAYTYEHKNGYYVHTRITPKNDFTLPNGEKTRNALKHVLVSEQAPENLPCEYIASVSFVHDVSDDEIGRADGTPYAESTQLSVSPSVTVNRIMNFLGTNERHTLLKGLLYAVLSGKSAEKPIFICDAEENIPLWIGAVCFALPKNIARSISFTTSCIPTSGGASYRLCGICSEDMNQDVYDSIEDSGCLLFDMKSGEVPEFSAELPIYDFLADSLLHSYGEIESFKSFTEDCFSNIAEDQLSNAYNAYVAIRKGVSSISFREFATAAMSVNNYGNQEAYIRLVEACLESQSAVCTLDPAHIVSIMIFMCGKFEMLSYKIQNRIREFIVRVSLAAICAGSTEEKLFAFYEKACICADSADISLSCSLMSRAFRKYLVALLASTAEDHQVRLICRIYKEYLVERKLTPDDLTIGADGGSFIKDFIDACAPYNENSATYILRELSFDAMMLCSAYLTIEESLEERFTKLIPIAQEEFLGIAATLPTSEMYKYLITADRAELVYAVFSSCLTAAESAEEITALFEEHDKSYFSVSDSYFTEYYQAAIELYYELFRDKFPKELPEGEFYALHSVSKHRVCIKYNEEICFGVVSRDLNPAPNKKQTELLWLIADYVQNVCNKPLKGKLLCLCFGAQLEGVDHKKDYDRLVPTLQRYTKDVRVDLSVFDKKDCEDYIEWIVPYLSSFLPEYEDLSEMYSFFTLDEKQDEIFIGEFAKSYVKDGKSRGNYTALCEFTKFVINHCTNAGKRACGIQMSKLNNKNTELLKMDAVDYFGEDLTMYDKFSNILNTQAEKTSIFQKLFGKK